MITNYYMINKFNQNDYGNNKLIVECKDSKWYDLMYDVQGESKRHNMALHRNM